MKRTIFVFIIGILVSGTVAFAANYLYQADEVSYTPDNNEWDVDNVDDALKDLYNRISSSNEALTSLKNTAIAKAVGADGNDFPSVINKLGTILNQGNKSFTVSDTNALTIPAGYYNGTGTIKTSGLVPTPTGTKSITANGSNIDVKNYATVNVNIKMTNKILKVYSSSMVTPDGNTWFYRPNIVLTDGVTVSSTFNDNGEWSGYPSTNIFSGFFNYVRKQHNVAEITPLLVDVYRLSGNSITKIPRGTSIEFDCRDTQFMLIY